MFCADKEWHCIAYHIIKGRIKVRNTIFCDIAQLVFMGVFSSPISKASSNISCICRSKAKQPVRQQIASPPALFQGHFLKLQIVRVPPDVPPAFDLCALSGSTTCQTLESLSAFAVFFNRKYWIFCHRCYISLAATKAHAVVFFDFISTGKHYHR